MKNKVLMVNATIFGIVAIVHLLRVIFGWELNIGNYMAPMTLSVVAFVILAIMTYMNIRAYRH